MYNKASNLLQLGIQSLIVINTSNFTYLNGGGGHSDLLLGGGGLSHGATAAAGGTHALLEQLEGALLGHVAHLLQLLDGLHAGSVLPAAHDTAGLGLHQILLGQATGGMLSSAMEHLGLAADSHLGAAGLLLPVLTGILLASVCHFLLQLYAKKCVE